MRPNDACEWIETREEFDCSALWPTAPPENGCCAGDTEKSSVRCLAHDSQRCDRISSLVIHSHILNLCVTATLTSGINTGCHWVVTDDVDDCKFEPPETAPGCCYISEYQNPNTYASSDFVLSVDTFCDYIKYHVHSQQSARGVTFAKSIIMKTTAFVRWMLKVTHGVNGYVDGLILFIQSNSHIHLIFWPMHSARN